MRQGGDKAWIAVGEPEKLRVDVALAFRRLHHLLHFVRVENALYVLLPQVEQRLQNSRIADEHCHDADGFGSFQGLDHFGFDALDLLCLRGRKDRQLDVAESEACRLDCRAVTDLFQAVKYLLVGRRYLGRLDNEIVVVLQMQTADSEVAGPAPDRLSIPDDELVVHQMP